MKLLDNRPWHDAQAIACACTITCANKEKEGLGGQWKACPKVKLHGLISLWKILNYSRIHFNGFNRSHFKLILLTLLFKSLFFKTNLNCCCILLLDIFSIIMQWGFCKYFLSKKIKTVIFISAFPNRKLIVTSLETCSIYFKLGG